MSTGGLCTVRASSNAFCEVGLDKSMDRVKRLLCRLFLLSFKAVSGRVHFMETEDVVWSPRKPMLSASLWSALQRLRRRL